MVGAAPITAEDASALAAELARGASPELREVLSDGLRAWGQALARYHFLDPDDAAAKAAIIRSIEAVAAAIATPAAPEPATDQPAALSHTTVPFADMARAAGYSGDACAGCGGVRMRRSGTCLTCDDCGAPSGGCS